TTATAAITGWLCSNEHREKVNPPARRPLFERAAGPFLFQSGKTALRLPWPQFCDILYRIIWRSVAAGPKREEFMRVLGIDPGYAIVGWGVVEYIGNRFTPVDFGAVTTPADMPFEQRLAAVYEGVSRVMRDY